MGMAGGDFPAIFFVGGCVLVVDLPIVWAGDEADWKVKWVGGELGKLRNAG